jgi:hypothetical protein
MDMVRSIMESETRNTVVLITDENQTNIHLKRLLILDSKGTQDETPFNTLLLRHDFRSNEHHAVLNGLLVNGRKFKNGTPRRQLTFRCG